MSFYGSLRETHAEGSLMGKPVIPISRLDFATAFIPSTPITLNLTKF